MEIVEELYHYYKNLFAQPGTVPGNHHEIWVEKEYNKILKLTIKCKKNIRPTSVFEIKRIIKEVHPKKSAGLDNISNFIIKKLPPVFLECLCSCFNKWLSRSQFPEDSKIVKNCNS
jgi:hypothetical protein